VLNYQREAINQKRAYGMKILMATGEFAPLASAGELGGQVRTLAVELKKLGHDVSVVIPFYRSVREGNYDVHSTGVEFQVNLGAKRATTEIFETQGPDQIQVFLVRRDEYFDRSAIYSADGRPYDDNAERFIFFSKSVVELGRRLTPSPDILHSHDWTTALVPVFVKERQLPFLTVLTIHDLESQGSFWSFDFALTNLPGSYFGPRSIEFYGRLNFLKGGILYGDAVTLPGEPELHEAFTPEAGHGLHLVLQENASRTAGIPFGTDYSATNLPFERLVPKKPKNGSVGGKIACREALLRQHGLDATTPGMILACPLQPADEKALASIAPLLDLILTATERLVILGSVPESFLASVLVAERKYPDRFAVVPNNQPKTEQLLLAGADAILLPSSLGFRSRTAIAALRYGTVPVVKFRGGLLQIVVDVDLVHETGYGFVYYRESPNGLWDSIQRAKWLYTRSAEWQQLIARAQSVDFSWAESAKAFSKLYANLLRHRQVA
jgi:starch synthase